MTILRILLAECDTAALGSQHAILASRDDIAVIETVTDGASAVEATKHHHPDVIVVATDLPIMNGFDVTHTITQPNPSVSTPVLLIASDTGDEALIRAIRAGARGFLRKHVTSHSLLTAVYALAGGGGYLGPLVTRQLLTFVSSRIPDQERTTNLRDVLSERELTVLTLVARGHSNVAIAQALTVAESTVKSHVSSILTKLGVTNRLEASLHAYRSGLVLQNQPAPPKG